MKKETPILLETAEISSISKEEKNNFGEKYYLLDFDERRDFLIDDDLEGIVLKVDLVNNRYFEGGKKGARRHISFNLIDLTDRLPVMSVKKRVNFPREDPYATVCCDFPHSEACFKSEHGYKILLKDETSHDSISEISFHTFGQKEMGHPSEWFRVPKGGIRPAGWRTQLCRSLEVDDFEPVYAKFVLDRNRDLDLPLILPQFELRLHHSDGEQVDIIFKEPELDEAVPGRYILETKVDTHGDRSGIFYAELLCMQFPIAGFVFSLRRTIKPEWTGDGIRPLDEYSADAVNDRFIRLVDCEPEEDDDDSVFEKALDDFIKVEEYTFPEWDEEQGRYVDKKEEENKPDEEVEETSEEIREEKKEADTPLLATLDHLTGLPAVKEKLSVYERVVRFNKMRADRNLPVPAAPLHAMFLGSPGTGKTTVARMMGVMLHRAGMLSKGHVVVKERATLLGQNYNSEAENTLEALKAAEGGILFIDEAYQLYQRNDPRDPGKFVIETLLTALADDTKRDWMLILAGYPEEMKRMFEMNPGFKSRIPESNIYQFDDFKSPELMDIAEKYLARHQYQLSPEAREALSARIEFDYRNKDKSFGNARYVLNLIQTEILPAMAVRVVDSSSQDLSMIEACDIPASPGFPKNGPRPRVGFRA